MITEIEPGLAKCWHVALDYWGTSIQLSDPVDLATFEKDSDRKSIAYIDMKKRQVVYNRVFFEKNKILHCLPAAFAHEIGHHIRFPATQKISADLMLLAEDLIPGLPFYHLNIFWDLLVNEFVGRDLEMQGQLKEIYLSTAKGPLSNYYKNYLAIYEAIWRCEGYFGLNLDHSLVAYATNFADIFYQLPNFHEQFVYFLSHFIANFPFNDLMGSNEDSKDPFQGDSEGPDGEDFPADGALSKVSKKAIEKATIKGWIKTGGADIPQATSWKKLANILGRRPGHLRENVVYQASVRFYKNYIEQLISLMPSKIKGFDPENVIPSVLEDWDNSDDIQSINWTESYLKSGTMAPAFLLKRELVADDPSNDEGFEKPRLEVYLDTSGSMPKPSDDINMMTVAALVLATYAIRKKGAVRGSVYSDASVESDWMLSEGKSNSFFLQFMGGGTQFPFDVLSKWTKDEKKVHRVIISDSDFMYNVGANFEITVGAIKAGLENSLSVTFLLHRVAMKTFRSALGNEVVSHRKCRFIEVKELNDFLGITTKLAQAIFGEKE